MSGWIKDYRKEVESNIWLMPPMYHRLWQWLKYSVNHKDAQIPNRDGTFTTIKAGQRATSYRQISKCIGYYEGVKWKEPNVKTVKSILDWMVKQNMITVQGNTLGTIITIENWSFYQEKEDQGNTKRITEETPSKHSMDTNKNDKERLKNDKKSNSRFAPPTYDEVKAYCVERKNNVDPNKFIDFYESKGWMVGKNKMKSWKAAVRNWERSDKPKVDSQPQNRYQMQNSELGKIDNDELKNMMKNKRGR